MIGYLLLRDHNDYNLIPLARPGDDQPEPQRIPADALHRLLGLTLSAGSPAASPWHEARFIRRNDAYVKVAYDEILWLEASRSYCILHFGDGHEWTVSYPLAEVARRFPCGRFLRIHRSFLVNIRHIDSFAGNQLLIGGRYLPIGQQYKERILACFDFLKTENKGPDEKPSARKKAF